MPLVSVLMPVYNASEFLKEAIDSILHQTFEDFELILINDGSTDNSEAIIRSYRDERIRYHYQPNAGVASALNTGIKLTKGKYIWRHDADDTSLPTKLASQVNFLEANPEVALCGTQVAFMTEAGKIAYKFRQPNQKFYNGAPFIRVKREMFNPYSPITHATVLVKREVIVALGGFRTAFQTAEDVDLWLRLIEKHQAVVLNSCDYFVRLNKTSATQRHGWKNEFFRNLAFKFYDQRATAGKDDLQKGIQVVLPSPPLTNKDSKICKGCIYRSDLLSFLYPLHLNAKDYKSAAGIVKYAIADGWKIAATWRAIILPLLGQQTITSLVNIKKKLYAR